MRLWLASFGIAFVQANQIFAPVRKLDETPATVVPRIVNIKPVVGEWHNCQPIRICEGISLEDRFYKGDLPTVYFAAEQTCSYKIDENELFDISNIDKRAEIRLKKFLDREKDDVHEITIRAFSCSGDEIASRNIKIDVCDINDHIPWLDPHSLSMTYCPDMKIGSTIGKLSGSDMDIGAYGKVEFFFTHRKPFGSPVLVRYYDGRVEEIQNIFRLDSDGTISVTAFDPRINNKVRTLSIEVGVRDHPGNPIYGSRSAQVIIYMCNQAPEVESCDLGIINENSRDAPEGSSIRIVDRDADERNGFVEIEVLASEDPLDGAIELVPTVERVDGLWLTTAKVNVLQPFNYELPGAQIETRGSEAARIVNIKVLLHNSKAKNAKPVEAICTLRVKDVNDPLAFRKMVVRSSAPAVIESCQSQVGKRIDNLQISARDEDSQGKEIGYSSDDEFFEVSTDFENKVAKVVLKKVIDRELHCRPQNPDSNVRYYRLLITATERNEVIDEEILILCKDINDQQPLVILSSGQSGVCRDLRRSFDDKEFLLQHGIDNIEINDGIDGLNVVAIALIDDRDDDALGHGAPFSFSIVNEGTTKDNKDDFRFLSTAHPRVYLLAYEGEYDLGYGERIKFTVSDNSTQTFSDSCPAPARRATSEYSIMACDCDDNEDWEYYPKNDCAAAAVGGIWWMLLLLLLLSLLLLCCCYYWLCMGVAGGTKDTEYVYKYDKPDWYYYMFNLMKKDNDDKVVVDHAQVDHPATIGGVLDKSKKEVDEINTTYDEVRIYNSSYQKGRASISAMSEITGINSSIANGDSKVDWTAIMKNVPRIEETNNSVDGERSQSPISNITDITVNENRVKFLNGSLFDNVVIKKSLFATSQVINESQTQSIKRQSRRNNLDVSSNAGNSLLSGVEDELYFEDNPDILRGGAISPSFV